MEKVNKRKVFKVVGWLVAVGISVMLLGLLNRCDDVNIKWQEEVRMSEGKMLLVDRTAKGKLTGGYGMGGTAGWKEEEMSLEVRQLPAAWAPPPVWRKKYAPILLDYHPQERTWRIVATHLACKGWERLGRPDLPYVEYQSRNGGPWEIIPLEEQLIGRKANLFPGMRSGVEPELVTLEETDKHYLSPEERYQRIISVWQPDNCLPNLEGK